MAWSGRIFLLAIIVGVIVGIMLSMFSILVQATVKNFLLASLKKLGRSILILLAITLDTRKPSKTF